MGLAAIMDQMQLSYISSQSVLDAMRQLASDVSDDDNSTDENKTQPRTPTSQKKGMPVPTITGPTVVPKKGVFQMFETISKSHLNSRLWIRSRLALAQYMFNQLIDAGKAKGKLVFYVYLDLINPN